MMRKVIQGLIILGIIISSITLIVSRNPEAYCGVSGCTSVLTSPYASLLGIPLGVWGVLYYASLLLTFTLKRWRVYTLLLALGMLVSVYLTFLEFFVLHAVCQYCLASASIVLILTLFHAARVWEVRVSSR